MIEKLKFPTGLYWSYWGYLYTPDVVSGKLPLVIFAHGLGETGNADGSQVQKLNTNGPFAFLTKGWKPNFLALAMQAPTSAAWSISPESIEYVLKNDPNVKKNWDGKNVLITGLSAGGAVVIQYAKKYNKADYAYIPMSPVDRWVDNKAPLGKYWFFTGTNDVMSPKQMSVDMVNQVKAVGQEGILSTPFTGHGPWNPSYDPTYKDSATGKNIYDWWLSTATTPPVEPPVPTVYKLIVKDSSGATLLQKDVTTNINIVI